jgi:hypothetical protein
VGRDSTGAVQTEIPVKPAETVYVAFDGAPYRWGDYTEMTIAPDGSTFWYLGEYSKITGDNNGRWGTWISSFSFGCKGGGNTPPVAVIDTPVQCSNLDCNFVGHNSTDDNAVTSYAWDFGDSSVSNEADPSHGYAANGTYDVSLTVGDADGASSTAYTSVTVDDGINNPPSSLTVANIFLDTVNQGGGNKSPRATVTITDDLGNPVGSVGVAGIFTGDGAGSDSGVTGAGGTVVLTSPESKKGKVNFRFCVTSVSDSGSLSWDGGPACANF